MKVNRLISEELQSPFAISNKHCNFPDILAGVPRMFSVHSLRIGSVTSAESRGLPRYLVKTMGCLSREACLLYARTSVDSLLLVSLTDSPSLLWASSHLGVFPGLWSLPASSASPLDPTDFLPVVCQDLPAFLILELAVNSGVHPYLFLCSSCYISYMYGKFCFH